MEVRSQQYPSLALAPDPALPAPYTSGQPSQSVPLCERWSSAIIMGAEVICYKGRTVIVIMQL